MSDGNVVIKVVANAEEADGLLKKLIDVDKQAKGMSSNNSGKNFADDMAQSMGKAEISAGSLFKALAGSQIVAKGFDMIKDSIGSAVSRFDTMKQFPKMMEKLGFSTETSERSIKKLSDGIQGLPTRLDEVVATTQQITTITGDLNYATELTLALNNAFLSSGAGAEAASRGMTQFTQMLATGKVDMQSWHTLNETMSLGLRKTAEAFGYAGDSAVNDLYKALKNGDVTFREFSQKLIELDKVTGGFAETALEGSKGLATSWTNIKTAVVNGITGLINTLDSNLKKITGKNIYDHLEGFKNLVKGTFNAVNSIVSTTADIVAPFTMSVVELVKQAEPLKPVLIGAAAGFAALMIVQKLSSPLETVAIQALYAKGAIVSFVGGLKGLTVTQAVSKIVTGGFAAMTGAVKAFFVGIGPIGWAVAGITAVGAAVAVTVRKSTAGTRELIDANKETAKSIEKLGDEAKIAGEKLEKETEYLEQEADIMKKLSEETIKMANNKNRGAGETKNLKENIEALNKYMGQEIIQYDNKTKGIKGNIDALEVYIKLAEEEKKLSALKKEEQAIQERQIELDALTKTNSEELTKLRKEESEVTKLAVFTRKKLGDQIKEAEAAQKQSVESSEENNKKLAEIEKKKQELYKTTEALENKVAEAAKNKVSTFEDLEKREQDLVEEMKKRYNEVEATTSNMFSKIENKSKVSKKEILKNLRENQEAVANWGDNIAKLTKKGIDEGIIAELRAMGPAGAAQVKEFLKMTDKEIQELNKLWGRSGEVSWSAYEKALGKGKEQLPVEIQEMVTQGAMSLEEAVAVTDWEQYGYEIPKGIAKGASDTKEIKQAGKKLTKGLEESFIDEQGNITEAAVDLIKKSKRAMNKEAESNNEEVKASGKKVASSYSKGVGEGKKGAEKAGKEVAGSATKGMEEKAQSSAKKNKNTGAKIGDDLEKGIKSKKKPITDASGKLVTDAKSKTSQEVKTANFNKSGKDIGDNLKDGIKNKQHAVKNSMKAVTDDLKSATNYGVLKTNAVAKKNLGLMQNVYKAQLNATTRQNASLMVSLMKTFNQSGQARTAGQNTIQGFITGLGSKGKRLASTAWNLAKSAVGSMKKALGINSPAKETIKVGEGTGEGQIIGMKNKLGEIKKTADLLGESSIPKVNKSKLFKIGAENVSGGLGVVNSSSKTETTNETVFNVDKIIWQGKEDIRKTMEEMGWIAGQEKYRLEGV